MEKKSQKEPIRFFIKKKLWTTIIMVFLFFVTSQINAQTQIGLDIDGEATSDRSGASVSISADGTTVAIGAPNNSGNGFYAGHVRIYKNVSGSWTQVGADINGEALGDNSGASVSLSSDGTTVAIGAPNNSGNGSSSGHVRVYRNISGTWTQVGTDIDGLAPGDFSGASVSLSSDGSTLAIGAPENGGNGVQSGQVRVFKNISGIWTQVGAGINGEAAFDASGTSVSLSSDGNRLAIGAPFNGANGFQEGHVRIYQNISGTWTQVGADIDGQVAGDNSGISVSLSSDGSRVAIGATRNSGNGTNSGTVRIYRLSSGSWIQVGANINGEAAGDLSGSSVSLSANGLTVAIGAISNSGNGFDSGHVRVFSNTANTWTQVRTDINGEAANDQSGSCVSLSSDGLTVAIGAPYNNGNDYQVGHVRVYDVTPCPFVGVPFAPAEQTFCNAATVADLVATINIANATIKWYASSSGGTALASTTVLSNGTYYVTQTSSQCESIRRPVTVIINPTPAAPTSSAQTLCNGATVANLVATGSGIKWYTASTGGTALVSTTTLVSGTYFASQTVSGCESARTSVAVTINTVVSVTAIVTNVTCNSGSNGAINLTPSGGTAPYTFNWGGGVTAEDRTGLAVGAYSVTITDANGCTRTVSGITVMQPSSIVSASSVVTNVSCNGGSNGAINIIPSGGTAPYTFNWGGGVTTEDRTGLTVGAYSVTITDAVGCTTTRNFTVTQPTVVSASSVVTNVACFGGSNGAINLTPSGGTAPYTFNWGGGVTTEDRTGLAAGTYSVAITDANGCTSIVSGITITQPTAVSATTAVTNVSCFGASNGTINLTPTGGTAPYTFNWGGGVTTEDRIGIASGTYSVTITDANGCTGIVSGITVTQPTAAVSGTTVITNVLCNGGSNGTINLTPTGGIAPYTFNWGGGVTTEDRTGLVAGNYSVTITDNNGCTGTVNVTVAQPNAFDATISQNAGILTANQNGATYQWYLCPNIILVGETNQSFTPASVGDYKVEIMVAGCMVTSACETVSVLGNTSFDITEFNYYPNPVIDNLNISYNKTISSVQIFDLTGRIVKEIQPNSERVEINLTELSSALYVAKVTCEDKTQTEIKIFKK